MKSRPGLLVLIFIFLFAGTAFAAETKPLMKKANIEISPNNGGVDVTEQITLANVEKVKDGKIEHTFTRFENAKMENLKSKAGEQELTMESQEGKLIDKFFISIPQGTSGEFTYTVTYHYGNTEVDKIPLVVPAVSSSGQGNDVSIKLTIPEGQYLQNSFPIMNAGDTGTITQDMMNIPNFLNVSLSSSPAGLFTISNMYTVFGLIVILGFIFLWLMSERKAKVGGVANV